MSSTACAAEDHVGADAERGVEVVPARLDEPVEDGLHVAGAAGDDGVEVAVHLRRLDEGDVLADEERQRLDEEVLLGDEVRVEDGEVLALGDGQRVVDVAGLGAVAGQPPDVVAAQLGREVTDLVGPAVVEDPRPVLAVHGPGGGGGPADGLDGLAVDGDEDVDQRVVPVEAERPLGGVLAVPGDPLRVEEGVPGGVVGVVAWAGRAREDRPHRQEGLEDEEALGDDDHRVRQPVAAVRGVEQEARVEQDTERGDDGQQDHDRAVVRRDTCSTIGQDLGIAAGKVVGRVEGQGGTPVPVKRLRATDALARPSVR